MKSGYLIKTIQSIFIFILAAQALATPIVGNHNDKQHDTHNKEWDKFSSSLLKANSKGQPQSSHTQNNLFSPILNSGQSNKNKGIFQQTITAVKNDKRMERSFVQNCATSQNHKQSNDQKNKVVSVPEPGTIALFSIGLLGLWYSRRKSRS